MTDCVVVIRTKDNDDILAILNGEQDGRVKIEHPYFIRVNPVNSNVAMTPYCPLSDERYFDLQREEIKFLVTANREITKKFLLMVDVADQELTEEILAEDEPLDELEAALLDKTFVKGSDTRH
jgi:hypothetical protein